MSTMLNVQSSVRLDRLRLLADYLEFQVSDEHFSMGGWGNRCDPKAVDFCGCAAGHGVALFREDGLYLFAIKDKWHVIMLRGNYGLYKLSGITALSSFFDIDLSETGYLFGPHFRTRLEEVQIIREFITKMETTP